MASASVIALEREPSVSSTYILGLLPRHQRSQRRLPRWFRGPLRRNLIRSELASRDEGLRRPASGGGARVSSGAGTSRGWKTHLWYTALNAPNSPMSSSNKPAGTEVAGKVMGGLAVRMTACNDPSCSPQSATRTQVNK